MLTLPFYANITVSCLIFYLFCSELNQDSFPFIFLYFCNFISSPLSFLSLAISDWMRWQRWWTPVTQWVELLERRLSRWDSNTLPGCCPVANQSQSEFSQQVSPATSSLIGPFLLFQVFPDSVERFPKLSRRVPSIVVELTDGGEVESGELRWPPDDVSSDVREGHAQVTGKVITLKECWAL